MSTTGLLTRPVLDRRAYVPGTDAAALLFDHGLDFDAVVRALVTEVGLDADLATSATEAAEIVCLNR